MTEERMKRLGALLCIKKYTEVFAGVIEVEIMEKFFVDDHAMDNIINRVKDFKMLIDDEILIYSEDELEEVQKVFDGV